tara:strand:+ start:694 stop:858 length:165 start_codon:yes stop_codon:yes gene_type:complete
MANQDLILGKDKISLDPDKAAADTKHRRQDDEEQLRKLLKDLIYKEIKNLFVKK